jgi:hypothetical protein
MFNTGPAGIDPMALFAWGVSNAFGLSRVLGYLSPESHWAIACEKLTIQNANVLQPFTLSLGGLPQDQHVRLLVQRATDLLLLSADPPAITVPNNRAVIKTALRLTLRELESEIGAMKFASAAQARALIEAILDLSTTGMMVGAPELPADYAARVRAATAAVKRNWFAKLQRARANLRAPIFIDFRGCNLGNSTEFLEAAKFFFGNDPVVEPVVSAPIPLMAFVEAKSEIVYIEDKDFEKVANEREVTDALEHWADVVDIKTARPPWPRANEQDSLRTYLGYAKMLPVVRVLKNVPKGKNDLRVTYYVDLNYEYNAGLPPPGRRKVRPLDAELWLVNQWEHSSPSTIRKLVEDWTRGTPPPVVVMRPHMDQIYAVPPDPAFMSRIASR